MRCLALGYLDWRSFYDEQQDGDKDNDALGDDEEEWQIVRSDAVCLI